MRARVTRRVRWEAAHYLPNHPGSCRHVHGHSWVAEVAVEGEIDAQTGMIVDMGDLAAFFRTELEPVLDHAMLNDVIALPTTENVALWLIDRYRAAGFPVAQVTVRETENQSATVFA